MLLNKDFEKDLKKIMVDEGTNCRQLSIKMGVSNQLLNRQIKNKVVTDSFIKILDELGYDVEVVYHKREN